MIATAVVGLLVAACLGAGSAVLSCLSFKARASALDHYVWSFAIGFGAVGWLIFFFAASGLLGVGWLFAVLLACVSGLFLRNHTRPLGWSISAPSLKEAIGLIAVLTPMAMSVLEGVSPPTDADSLAYHFALPKQFLAAGRLEFIPRAIDGAVPLLPQMTYMAALGLGGERAMTLWTMIAGWGAVALTYTLARQYLSRAWSLALASAFYTIPAVVYGANSGQVEVKLSMFATIAAFSAAKALHSKDARYAASAGLAAGFFVGGKLTGLLFAACCGATLMMQRRWLAHGAAFAGALAIAGFQWPFWNWIHSGDPFFPLLFGWLPYRDLTFWNGVHDTFFRAEWNKGELPLPKTLWWLIAYPFAATFDPENAFDAARTGFGLLPVLLFPFAAFAAFSVRNHMARNELWTILLTVSLFYGMWFFFGPSQRIRHLLPILPALLIVLAAASVCSAAKGGYQKPLVAAIGLAVFIQLGGQTLYVARYAKHVLSGGDRGSLLESSVFGYPAVAWVNGNVPQKSLIATNMRQLIYLFERPVYYAHPVDQARLNLRPDATLVDFIAESARLGITHVVVTRSIEPTVRESTLARLTTAMIDRGCGEILAQIPLPSLASRTLPGPREIHETAVVARLDPISCQPAPR